MIKRKEVLNWYLATRANLNLPNPLHALSKSCGRIYWNYGGDLGKVAPASPTCAKATSDVEIRDITERGYVDDRFSHRSVAEILKPVPILED